MTGAISLYRRVLGPAFEILPPRVRAMHGPGGVRVAAGRCTVERGRHPFARFAAALFGMPRAGRDIPVRVVFRVDGDRVIWARDFAGQAVLTRHGAAQGGGLVERFGICRFTLRLEAHAAGVRLALAAAHAFGIRLPRSLHPTLEAREFEADGRFHFDVRIGFRFTGPMIRYCGWLVPDAAAG